MIDISAVGAPLLAEDGLAVPEPAGETPATEYSAVMRHDVVSSPQVLGLFRVQYAVNKPLEGLPASPDDGNILPRDSVRLFSQDADSFGDYGFDDLDDEMLKYTEAELKLEEREPQQQMEAPEVYSPVLDAVIVRVHKSQLTVGKEAVFKLPSTVRACAVLRGAQLAQGKDEDSVLLTLTSGFLLLIRLFQVGGGVKPYVVQWWRASHHDDTLPVPTTVGREIITHDSGSAIAIAAHKDVIRLHCCVQTRRGVMLDKIQNLYIDGTILHTCFLETPDPSADEHAMLCSLMVTSDKRYIVRLFEWWPDEERVSEHTPLLFPSGFDIPVFTLPFKESIFMMMEKSIVLVSANNILAGDHKHTSVAFPGSFPVGVYRPTTRIIAEDPDNEILVATEDGTIYSVVIFLERIHIRPILRVPHISQFILEKEDAQYHLIYASDFHPGGYIIFDDVEKDAHESDVLKPSRGERSHSWDNWAPLWDLEVVDSQGQQELWLAHGKSLSQMKKGLPASLDFVDATLKYAVSVFHHFANDTLYFILGFVDASMIFKLENDTMISLEDTPISLTMGTVHISSYGEICIQVREDAIVAFDFEKDQGMVMRELEGTVVLADCLENTICVVTESVVDDQLISTMSLYQLFGDLNVVCTGATNDKPNFVTLITYDDELYIVIGCQFSLKLFQPSEAGFTEVASFWLTTTEPHSLVAHDNVLYVGSRFGQLSTYKVFSDEGSIKIKEFFTVDLCHTPLKLHLTPSYILLVSRQVWRLEFGSKHAVPIIIQEQKERPVYCAISVEEDRLALVRDGGFALVDVSPHPRPVFKSIDLGQVPKKVFYLSHLRLFAILCENTLLFANKQCSLPVQMFSRKENRDIFENKTLLSICEWIVPTLERAHRNLIVGLSSKSGGALKFLQPKVGKVSGKLQREQMQVYEMNTIKTPGAVLVVKQLNERDIIYSSGSDLYTVRYNKGQSNMEEPILVRSLNSLITGVEIGDGVVAITTKDYPLIKLCCTGWEVVEDDSVYVKATSSLAVPGMDITTDKLNCTVSGIQSGERKFKSYLHYVAKLKRCDFKPLWYHKEVTRFLAFGIAGDIQMFTLLSEEELYLYAQHYNRKRITDRTVTKKGLWELDEAGWISDRDENVLDSGSFETTPPEYLQELLESVGI